MASKLTSGFVLKPPKVAPTNATDTATPTNGVVRDVKPYPSFYSFRRSGAVDDIAGTQYRVAFLDGPNQEPSEYLVWAANNSNLALIEDDSWSTTDGTGAIPTGTVAVLDTGSDTGQRGDGSTRLVVTDGGSRSLAKILSVKVIRGDDGGQVEHTLTFPADFTVLDAETGLLYLEDNITTRSALTPVPGQPPAFSALRRDTITEVQYVVAQARFWWSRNDVYQTRFGWDGRTQRWEPLNGGAPSNLGTLVPMETYQLQPRPEGLAEGSYLPGDTDPDAYTMIRVGSSPDANSLPIAPNPAGPFEGVLVVADDSAANTFDFSSYSPPPSAVVGVTSGLVQWNQNFVAQNAGLAVWYVNQSFDPEASGVVGLLLDAKSSPLHISPVPGPTENPFIRLGSRRYLTAVPVATEAEQDALATVLEGTVSVAWSTGRLRFSQEDLAKADREDPGFDIRYLGVEVFYDGVSLNQTAQPVRNPRVIYGESGSTGVPLESDNALYLFNAEPLPGLGTSGVLHLPDGTGAFPEPGAAHLRSGGDESYDLYDYTGLLRWIEGLGDTILFTKSGAIAEVVVVDTPADIPEFRFEIPQGTGYITRSLERDDLGAPRGSLVELGITDRKLYDGELLYFLQAELTPAQYTEQARVFSRVRHTFSLTGTEVLYFEIDGTLYSKGLVAGPAGTYTAEQIAAHLGSGLASGRIYALSGHIVIEAEDPSSGSVEIGSGEAVLNTTGAAALGLLPGWRVDTTDADTFWLPDSGTSVGLFRSPANLDRTAGVPDSQARARFDEEMLVPTSQPQPFVFLTNPPLRDIAGYDEDVFFKMRSGDGEQQLQNFSEVEYLFTQDQPKYAWLEGHTEQAAVTRPLTSLNFQRTNISAPTLLEVTGGGLYVSEDGGPTQRQELGTDYLLDAGGSTGSVTLIEQVSGASALGARGAFSAGTSTFTDPTATLQTDGVQPGYRLKITSGDATGQWYIVHSVVSETVLRVRTPFAVSYGGIPAAWEIYEGYTSDVYDPGLLADVVYENFNHLLVEPFEIRLLSSVGTLPVDEAAQLANRSTAFVADAVERGRLVSVRFGLTGVEAALTPLQSPELGTIANGLIIPEAPSGTHFVEQAFAIQVGGTQFTHSSGLIPVASFTVPAPAAGTIEYLTSTGELAFAADLLADYQQATVLYQQLFLAAGILPAGTADVDPLTGELNFSAADLATYSGETGYFVEQMVTEGNVDVSMNPIAGSFAFFQPLREGQIVEAHYFVADNTGAMATDDDGVPVEITEFLPLYVRAEEAVRVTPQVYSFNAIGKTADERIEPSIYIDVDRQNYGPRTTAEVLHDPESRVNFQGLTVDASSVVTVSYAVLEAFGGETGYSTGHRPVYRPPFFLEAGQSEFDLEGNRTGDMLPGKVLRLGARPLYIKSASWDATADTTSVVIYPTLDQEVGIRAPGNDVLSLLSAAPVAPEVEGVGTAADAGFMLAVTAAYAPVRKGTREVRFEGDLTRFAVAGHLLEVGGVPFLVVNATQAEDGATTSVEVSVAFPREYKFGEDEVRLSVRPIYPDGALQFVGLGPLLASEPFELSLFGEVDASGDPLPGRTLELGVEYEIDPRSGAISLIEGNQDGLRSGQKLFLQFTRLKSLGPQLAPGYVIIPRFRADFHHVTTPSDDNGYLGVSVLGTYSFHNPDSFFFQVDTLDSYLTQVQQDRVEELAAQNPSGGPIITAAPVMENEDQGTSGFDAQRRELLDRDRAGRTLLDFYNSTITAFEQIQETFDGTLIGDWDGKFRHFVGRGARFAPPGFEDAVTGYLNPRYVWSEVFLSETGARSVPLRALSEDPLVDPVTAVLANAELTGTLPHPNVLERLTAAQGVLLRNDVDDLLLVQRGVLQVTLTGFPPVRVVQAEGVFKSMAEPHQFSRLFPTSTQAFTTTVPGLGADIPNGDPGVYAYRRTIDNAEGDAETVSTFKQPIATLSNPVLGVLTNLTDATVSDRLARARVVSYSPAGYPDVDVASSGVPAVLLSVVPLSEFPVDTSTGLPDTQRLRSQAANPGAVFDIATGNPDLHTPPFEPEQQLALGRSDGSVIPLRYAREKFLIQGEESFGGVYVKEVLSGCILTFQGTTGDIVNSADLVTVDADGLPLPVELGEGDTILVVPNTSVEIEPSDPPTQEDIQRLAETMTTYRNGVDLEVDKQTGEVLDITLSSYEDPSNLALKEILGQNPPEPDTPIQASTTFTSGRTDPLVIPALQSQARNDSGDEGIPYKTRRDTEQVLLREVAKALVELRADTPIPSAVYPAEVLGTDGEVLGGLAGPNPPATLITSEDALPVTTAGSYTPYSGIGDVAEYDLLFVQVDDTEADINAGSQGILSVGSVSQSGGSSFLEPPRFVTQTRQGDRMRYILDNAMVHVAPTPGSSGAVVVETGGNTVITFTGVGFDLDDGTGSNLGGLNHILDNALLPFPNENHIVVRLFDQGTGDVLETVTYTGDPLGPFAAAIGGLGAVFNIVPITINDNDIIFPGVGFIDFAALGGTLPGPVGPFDVTISIDTFTPGFSGTPDHVGSSTAFIRSDRLTFEEQFDLSTARERGAGTGPNSIQTTLQVLTVTSPDSEDLSVNAPAEVNGNSAFTFLERSPGVIGTFQPAVGGGDERGTLKVMAWEGFGNTPLPSFGPVQFSAVPSSPQDAFGIICQGEGGCNGDSSQYNVRVTDVDVLAGSLAQVSAGDILVVQQAADPAAAAFPGALATTKAGTYLVRQVVESNDTVTHPDRRDLTLTANVGDGFGWADVRFPRVASYNDTTKELTVSDIPSVPESPTTHAFPAPGAGSRVYVLVDLTEVDNAGDFAAYRTSVLSAEYGGINTATNTFSGLTDFRDAGDIAIASSAFEAAVSAGMLVSGMHYFQVQVGGEQGLPPSNVVGLHTTDAVYGLRHFALEGDVVTSSAAAALFYDGSAGEIDNNPGAGVGIVVTQQTPEPSTSFVADPEAAVFPNIPGVLGIEGISAAEWESIHKPSGYGAGATLIKCVLPGESFVTESSTSDPGFWAQAALFLEPSWPLPTQDLSSPTAHVVDINHSLPSNRLWMRDINDFLPVPISPPERVRFEVRRIRRFGEGVLNISEALQGLQFAYGTRRGNIVGYSTTRQMGIVETDGTQLGLLDDPRVNINPGDSFRLLDASGDLVQEVPILGVRSGTELLLSAPGLTEPLGGSRFEVYLRQALVPHEQSHAQLLELATDVLVRSVVADYGTSDGGFVDTTGVLEDSTVTGVEPSTFPVLGVAEGDYVVVDPAGELDPPGAPTVPERGAAPFGDFGVSTRVDGSYQAGGPYELDDNRGFYRVVEVNDDNLVLSGASEFAGDTASGDVIFESAGNEFVLYPTVHDSNLTGSTEGQNDLRRTAQAGASGSPAGSFQGNAFSVGPFSYRIVRPIGLLSSPTVELLLMLRERFLSWQEQIDRWSSEGGTFFIFQRDSHAEELTLGSIGMAAVSGLEGQIGISPFANDADCLSVLDRRLWVLDFQLDYTAPPFVGGAPYTSLTSGVGRPVFPDHIELALGKRDNLRDFRAVWLDYRANLVTGTLASVRRFDAQEPQREQDQRDLLRFRGGTG